MSHSGARSWELENEDTNGIVSFIIGKNGQYSFKRIDGETDYHIWATFRGHRSAIRKLSAFDSHQSKIINFIIKNE